MISVKLPWGRLDLRHTSGSQLAMKGESLYKILALMGNSPEICPGHYAALIAEALVDSVEFGESLRAPAVPSARTAKPDAPASLYGAKTLDVVG